MKNLAASIAEKGVLQPILVRPTGTPDSYEIIAGERRWRAAQAAKLHEVPVIVRTLTDAQSLEIAIIENVQRADLNAIEEGAAYQELMSKFRYTQEQVSDVVGKSRSHVANMLRLLKLPEPVKALISGGKLTAGHARTLIGVPIPKRAPTRLSPGA
jgi:ParB family chromosome partitioning protein